MTEDPDKNRPEDVEHGSDESEEDKTPRTRRSCSVVIESFGAIWFDLWHSYYPSHQADMAQVHNLHEHWDYIDFNAPTAIPGNLAPGEDSI